MDASSRYTHNTGANLGLVASILRSPAILNIDAASNFEISASGVHTTLGGAIFEILKLAELMLLPLLGYLLR